ncbi:hypothetical protein W97_05160 [Coniosporium apollinis CBS 100218]|uniref:Uncharacterized protein n=1 Tax=Coniosporium apollinis (strain CBS 100218) TaxID=1168221 RepID=R7YVP7_CONA1|nr:uncharacterized protein W97_05160 [Coniosporium apollinis CBS 100218]EON65918.1 hypothetical protein W97_05160 [Coniosporium apollinis CBS 100218]
MEELTDYTQFDVADGERDIERPKAHRCQRASETLSPEDSATMSLDQKSSRKTKEPKTKYPFQPAKPNKIKVGKEGFRISVPYDAKAHGPWKLPSLASINSWYGLTLPKGVKVWMYKKDGTLKAQWEIEVINLDKKKSSDTPLVAQQLDDLDHDDDTWTWPTFNTLHVGDPSRLATTARINSQNPNHSYILWGDEGRELYMQKYKISREEYSEKQPWILNGGLYRLTQDRGDKAIAEWTWYPYLKLSMDPETRRSGIVDAARSNEATQDTLPENEYEKLKGVEEPAKLAAVAMSKGRKGGDEANKDGKKHPKTPFETSHRQKA